jgi:hypothetical protein
LLVFLPQYFVTKNLVCGGTQGGTDAAQWKICRNWSVDFRRETPARVVVAKSPEERVFTPLQRNFIAHSFLEFCGVFLL